MNFNGWHFSLYFWKDYVEIALFTLPFFLFSLWLQQDKTKPLLLYFYGYCTVYAITLLSGFSSVSDALLVSSPFALICFIIIHQQILQKNFVSLVALKEPESSHTSSAWPELLVRAMLSYANHQKSLVMVIEKKDALMSLLEYPFILESPLSENLLSHFTQASLFDPNHFSWIRSNGKLAALNCSWKKNSLDQWLTQTEQKEQWLHDALFYASKTDALFLHCDHVSRTFTLVHKSSLERHLSAHTLLLLLKQHIPFTSCLKKGASHVIKANKKLSTEHTLS